MKVNEVRVELTRANTKQYESDKVALTAMLEDGDDVVTCIGDLKKAILGEVASIQGTATVRKTEVTKPAPVAEKKAEEKKVEKVETPQNEKAQSGEGQVSEEKAQETPVAEKKTGKVKVKPANTTPYDRDLDTHKKQLATFLDTDFPEWKRPENLPKASEASKKLVGSLFLDADGNILPSFKETFLAYLK